MVIWKFVLLAVLLVFSATFSGSETAFFSLKKWRLDRLSSEGKKWAKTASRLLRDSQALLITILIGNEIVNITASNLAADIRAHFFDKLRHLFRPEDVLFYERIGIVAAVFAMTFLLLVFGEITPKTLAIRNPAGFARVTSRVLSLFQKIAAPLLFTFSTISKGFTSMLDRKTRASEQQLTEEDFKMMVAVGEKEGVLEETELEMIHGVFHLGDVNVNALMVPRTEILCLSEDSTVEAALSMIRDEKHSRIPVFRGDIDTITGVIYARDLLGARFDLDASKDLKNYIRPVHYVPETKNAMQLLQEMRKKMTHIAIVLDEFGGTSGLITIEDLLEELFGEIEDDFDVPEEPFRKIDRTTWLAASRAELDDFNKQFQVSLEGGEAHTLGGYVFNLFGRLPEQGESIRDDLFTYTIEKLEGTRMVTIRVKRLPQDNQ
jgi:CBS domain containing-hemolysin-like protein